MIGKTGQIAIEGLLTISVVLVLYTILVFTTLSHEASLDTEAELMEMRRVCVTLREAISYVTSGGDGMTLTLEVITEDEILISGNFIEIGEENTYTCSTPIAIASTVLTGGDIRFSNEGMIITVENV